MMTLSSTLDLSPSTTYLKEEDVGALHAGVEDLRGAHLVGVAATHDLPATHDALHVVAPRDVHDERPVLGRMLVDLLGRADELRYVHPIR